MSLVFENLIAQSAAINTTITTYVVTPLLIFFAGIALSVLVRNILRAALQAVQLDMRFNNTSSISLSNTVANVVYVIGWILSAAIAVASIDLLAFTLQRIAFFLFWVGLLALCFALTDAARNMLKSSQAQKKYPIGSEYVRGPIRGVVKKHSYTHLIIFTDQVERVHVPYLTAARADHAS